MTGMARDQGARGPERMETADWAALGVLSLVWGASFLFYRVLAFQVPAFTTVFGRCAIGAAALAGFVALRGRAPLPPVRLWPRFLLLGLINNAIPFTGFAWGEARISGGTAAILNGVTPIFVVLITGLVVRTERLTGARIAGVLCGFAGVAVMVGPRALLGQDVLGQVACLVASLSYAFAAPYARSIRGVAPAQMAVGQLAASSAIMLPLWLAVDHPWRLPAPAIGGWASLLGIALLSTAFAYVIFFRLLARVGPTNVTLVTFLVPISAMLLDAIVLGEQVGASALLGMVLIAAGLACIDGRLLRLVRRRNLAQLDIH